MLQVTTNQVCMTGVFRNIVDSGYFCADDSRFVVIIGQNAGMCQIGVMAL